MAKINENLYYLSNAFNNKDLSRVSDSLTTLNLGDSDNKKSVRLAAKNYARLNTSFDINNTQFYIDYQNMDNSFPIIKSALDIYGEEICNKFNDGNIIKINSNNGEVKKELEKLFFKVLKINKELFKIARNTVKFGETISVIDYNKIDGVTSLIHLPTQQVFIQPRYNKNETNFYYTWNGFSFADYELIHWKNTERLENDYRGQSVLRCIVDTWRRVVLMREALIIYRITRAPSRYLFKIDTKGLSDTESLNFVKEIQKEFTKKPMVNPKTGEIDFTNNVLSIEDNVYVPVDSESGTDVSTLEGASNLDSVEDYKIIKDDIFAGLKIPKSYLTFEEDLSNKAALSEEDMRFSKTIQRFQSLIIEGLVQIAATHLYILGYDEEDIEGFTIEMKNPNTFVEKNNLDLIQKRIEIADALIKRSDEDKLAYASLYEVMSSVLQMSDEEINKSIKRQFLEKKMIKKFNEGSEPNIIDSDSEDNDKKIVKFNNLEFNDFVPAFIKEAVDILTNQNSGVNKDIKNKSKKLLSKKKNKLVNKLIINKFNL